MDAAERKEILSRYADHTRRFDELAARRKNGTQAEVIPFSAPLRELEQEPTMREIEVLQLISDGLVNREIGQRLFLSEETVKSPRPAPAREAAGPLARPCGRRRLPPRHHRLGTRTQPTTPCGWGGRAILKRSPPVFPNLWKSLNRGMTYVCGKQKLRRLYQDLPLLPATAANADRALSSVMARKRRKVMVTSGWGLTARRA